MLIRDRKTQIALAYVYWPQDACPEVLVFWVHASSAERFHQAYASIAQECQVPGYDDPKRDVLPLVRRWLERMDRGRWLMVIDNADDTQLFSQLGELGQYIPECAHGSVLAMTRNEEAGSRLTSGRRPIEVVKMDEGESKQLLQEKLEEDDLDPGDLSMLSSRLEHLLLALVQAAAFIQENTISVKEYLRLLDKSSRVFARLRMWWTTMLACVVRFVTWWLNLSSHCRVSHLAASRHVVPSFAPSWFLGLVLISTSATTRVNPRPNLANGKINCERRPASTLLND